MKELLSTLKQRNLSLASVESMTGGLFASEATSVPGASATFKGSIVTYQVEEKEKLLGIEESLINKFGVVSKEVAKEMSEKGRVILNSDICISVTGNAGPTSEPGGKEVGVVYISISSKDKNIVKEEKFFGERNIIRSNCVRKMIELIKEFVS